MSSSRKFLERTTSFISGKSRNHRVSSFDSEPRHTINLDRLNLHHHDKSSSKQKLSGESLNNNNNDNNNNSQKGGSFHEPEHLTRAKTKQEIEEEARRRDKLVMMKEGFREISEYKDKKDPELKRRFVLLEIYQNEENFVDWLRILKHKYMDAARSVLSADEHKKIFGELDSIIQTNTAIWKEMCSDNQSRAVSIYLRYWQFLKIYQGFILHDAPAASRQMMQTNPSYKKLLSETLDRENPTAIESYLIRPTQQLVRYPLLWTEVLKYTSPTEVAHAEITKLLEHLKQLASGINEAKRDTEHGDDLIHLTSVLKGFPHGFCFINPATRFVHGGPVHLIGQHAEAKEYYLWLLTDKLLFTKKAGEIHKFQGEVWLDNLKISGSSPQTGKWFILELAPSIGEKYFFALTCEEDRKKWTAEIAQVVSHFKPKGDSYVRINALFGTTKPSRENSRRGSMAFPLMASSLEKIQQNMNEVSMSSLKIQNENLRKQIEELTFKVEKLTQENTELREELNFIKK